MIVRMIVLSLGMIVKIVVMVVLKAHMKNIIFMFQVLKIWRE